MDVEAQEEAVAGELFQRSLEQTSKLARRSGFPFGVCIHQPYVPASEGGKNLPHRSSDMKRVAYDSQSSSTSARSDSCCTDVSLSRASATLKSLNASS